MSAADFPTVPTVEIVRAPVTAVLGVRPELPAGFAQPEPIVLLEVTGSPALVSRVVCAAADAVEDER